jgi:hypothetical protein
VGRAPGATLLSVEDVTVRFGAILALDTVSFTMRLVHVFNQCGNNLSRANIMRQSASIKDLSLALLLPGIKINTSPTDFYPIEPEQRIRFDG